jgi:hypothetical protein
VKMQAIENIQAESLIPVISRSVNPAAPVITDGGRGYITQRMPVAKLDRPDKLTRANRFILTRVNRSKLTTLNRTKLTRVNRTKLTTP